MTRVYNTIIGLVLLFVFVLPAIAAAETPDSSRSGLDWRSNDSVAVNYSEELHFGQLMNRIYTLMTSDEYFGSKCPQAKHIAEMLKMTGCFDAAASRCTYTMDNDKIHFSTAIRYDEDLSPTSTAGRTFGLEDKNLVSAEYMGGDHLLYFALQHVPERASIALDELQETDAAMSAAGMGDGMHIQDMFSEMGIDDLDQINQVLDQLTSEQGAFGIKPSGEIAFAVYDLPKVEAITSDNFSPAPGDFDIVVMLGLDKAEGLSSGLAGFGAMMGLTPAQNSPAGWQRYDIAQMPGAGLVFNDKVLIAATRLDAAIERATNADRIGGMHVNPCQYYMDVNLTGLHDGWVSPGVDSMISYLKEENPGIIAPSKEMSFLLALPESSRLGHLTVTGHHDNGYWCEGSLGTAAISYGVYYAGIAGCLAAQSEMAGHEDYGDDSDTDEAPEDGAADSDAAAEKTAVVIKPIAAH